jgi:hypothetical protein
LPDDPDFVYTLIGGGDTYGPQVTMFSQDLTVGLSISCMLKMRMVVLLTLQFQLGLAQMRLLLTGCLVLWVT